MEGPYKIVGEIYAHDSPIRSLSLGPGGDIVCGTQSTSESPPVVRRFNVGYINCIDGLEQVISETADPWYHDHWVTALTSSASHKSIRNLVVSGCMDSNIRLFDTTTSSVVGSLEGHAKGIISLNWTDNGNLLSGSWDGTAKVWDVESRKCIKTLPNHENGVHVIGLSSGLVVTTSTGESVNSKPANYKIRIWDISGDGDDGTLLDTIEDHEGSIRSVARVLLDRGYDGFATTSNDGSLKIRAGDGSVINNFSHTNVDSDGSPFVLDNCPLYERASYDDGTAQPGVLGLGSSSSSSSSSSNNRSTDNSCLAYMQGSSGKVAGHVSCAEDGSVMVWKDGQLLQSIPHPSCVWCVLELPSGEGEFATGCNDGTVRIFSREELKTMNSLSLQLQVSFLTNVAESAQRRKTGPTKEEIAKASKWESRGGINGTSEGQVMVFNKSGVLIAAQWSSASQAWVEVGEVTSGNSDGGSIDGVSYDHIMPVELESQSGLVSLKLGYNNGDAPYDSAQRFIDANGLPQHYLKQIAEWISANAGSKSTPTFDMSAESFGGDSAASVGPAVSYDSFPSKAAIVFDDLPKGFKEKLINKINEFNAQTSNAYCPESDVLTLSNLVSVLEETSRYHASSVSSSLLSPLFAIVENAMSRCDRGFGSLFLVFDILRVVVVHPDGAKSLSKHPKLSSLLDNVVVMLSSGNDLNAATALTTIRFAANMFRRTELMVVLLTYKNLKGLIAESTKLSSSSNKLVRNGLSTFIFNLFFAMTTAEEYVPQFLRDDLTHKLVTVCYDSISNESENSDVVYRSVAALGTIALKGSNATMAAILTQLETFYPKKFSDLLLEIKTSKKAFLNDHTLKCIDEMIFLIKNSSFA